MTEKELFSFHDHSELESEKITAPRYSYWQSVFRVFFRKKLNIFIRKKFFNNHFLKLPHFNKLTRVKKPFPFTNTVGRKEKIKGNIWICTRSLKNILFQIGF